MNNRIEIEVNKELRFKCVKDVGGGIDENGCNICVFHNTRFCYKLLCGAAQRNDNTNVHFELINE